ncbi:hypothetical protein Lesp02_02110 [Lentzea sp. NBRC 105346]|uniref:hypothetical protein n=1 Tax=Lentzea sp. NBRC 105346 TaxID=3032205 RepID=UPI0024A2D67D|nr:hypothetical protein [Lentzea sp. NBRC 105346]GLZ28021.1 hypothetical protein Lesp02_02110 [Lentzea sp. NBRC 105346]
MTAPAEGTSLRIGIIGPTRIGKTTLVNTLLRAGETAFEQTDVRMRWADHMTERKILEQRAELEGWRLSKQFNPGALRGTDDAFVFRFVLETGFGGLSMRLDAMDYPGGLVNPAHRLGREAEWEECRAFIANSTVLVVPADAAMLMETAGDENRHHLPAILTTPEIEDVARDWARNRHQHRHEPALAIVCPVRTESYFADNGGRRDRSDELLEHVREVYRDVLKVIRAEAPATRIHYCPVDTVGPVEFLSARWLPDVAGGHPHFSAKYRVRRRPDGHPPEISTAGIDDVLVLLARHLIDLRHRELDVTARHHRTSANDWAAQAVQDLGAMRNVWNTVSGKRRKARRMAEAKRLEAVSAEEQVSGLAGQLLRLAELGLGPRHREL